MWKAKKLKHIKLATFNLIALLSTLEGFYFNSGFIFIMSLETIRIPSMLYHSLSEKGGVKLIAVYSTLKAFKNGDIKYYTYTAKNNKFVSGYGLLRNKTNISLPTLKKYVPILIDMGLCSFHNNGDFVMLGGQKVKELYSSYKMIPIKIGENIIKTQYNCLSVKCHSEQRQQLTMISKKTHRRDLLKQLSNPTSLKGLKASKRIESKFGKKIEIIDNVVMSNQGFASLKDGSENNKSKGSYWKSRLVKNGIIKSTRRYELGEKMSYGAYLQYKKLFFVKGMTYVKGTVAKELVSGFSAMDLTFKVAPVVIQSVSNTNKSIIKPLSYLSFDFVAWLSNK